MRWLDTRTSRDVLVLDVRSVTDWPATAPWTSTRFGLFVVTDDVMDVSDAGDLATAALAQGLVAVAAWGPGCGEIESTFDQVIVGDGSTLETDDNVILTTSHQDESLESALELFLEVLFPPHSEDCTMWVVVAFDSLAASVERLLVQRGARCLSI